VPLTVTLPPMDSAPTGQVFNPTSGFVVKTKAGSGPGLFIFSSEGGQIIAWNPVAAALALVFGYSLVNTFLVEAIFDWPGLGEYATASIQTLDTPAILGVTLFIALVYVGANLIVDIGQAVIDPRIRLR